MQGPSVLTSSKCMETEHAKGLSTSLVRTRTHLLSSSDPRPKSHPQSISEHRHFDIQKSDPVSRSRSFVLTNGMWPTDPSPVLEDAMPVVLGRRPQRSMARLSSMDQLLTYRDEKRAWKRNSMLVLQRFSNPSGAIQDSHLTAQDWQPDEDQVQPPPAHSTWKTEALPSASGRPIPIPGADTGKRFRTVLMEAGFCFTIAMTQFLAEYLISGFAMELPHLLVGSSTNMTGIFWPASLLSLVLSAMLLIFARLSDMYGGYPCFMFGVTWLTIWTLLPGFLSNVIVLDVARAMQGMAIAAFTPSAYGMIAANYAEGPRRNTVMGLYSGCAPLGFFFGMMAAGALPAGESRWYFWIAAALSFTTAVTAYLTVPRDLEHQARSELKMDWVGAFLITIGLILIAYALAVEPEANKLNVGRSGFSYPIVIVPLLGGLGCLALATWVEGSVAACPLLPLSFFRPTSAISLSLASLCFYATYGVWLYMSVEYLQSDTGTTTSDQLSGVTLALWYAPTAIGGLVLCVVGSRLIHLIPIQGLLLVSGLAWIAAPLLLAVSPLPLNYWAAVFPSMLCATLGIDLTYTITCVFFSSVQPLQFQGLAGAVCSILVNLAMSFALPISEVVKGLAREGMPANSKAADQTNWGIQAALIYGAASAGLGFFIALFFVRISRRVVRAKPTDEERPWAMSSETTIVAGMDDDEADQITLRDH